MPIAENLATPTEAGAWESSLQAAAEAQSLLKQVFGVEFHLLEVKTGRVVHRSAHQPFSEAGGWAELCREVARRGQAEFIGEESPFLVLAIPLGHVADGNADTLGNNTDDNDTDDDDTDADTGTAAGLVAIAAFPSRPIDGDDDISQAARLLGFDVDGINAWASCQTPWSPKVLLGVGRLFLERLADRQHIEGLHRDKKADRHRIKALMEETQSLAENLSSTYEEVALLYRRTKNLKLSKDDQQLGRMALEWLYEVVPAEAIALLLPSVDSASDTSLQQSRGGQTFLTHGECPVDAAELTRLIDHLKLAPSARPFVANASVTSADTWPCDKIHQAVVVPLAEGENVFGWLLAINHVESGKSGKGESGANEFGANESGANEFGANEFGTVEASLLSSVGTILGIHSRNIDLYRQQSEMFSGIVRALTSAIDAKDGYTHGHSDRVAQISVRLASELGCDEKMLETIYLAGLLHDIGKIGIDDLVLRKPDKLSDEEYEHIKSHAEVGHRILHDLKQMDDVLPVVLHHHESWDGRGYPHHLPTEEIPLAARIVAVADSYDAMSSDRPYRKGMPEQRIDDIFREGAGKQWDPQVIYAFFSAREDIREIANREPNASDANKLGG